MYNVHVGKIMLAWQVIDGQHLYRRFIIFKINFQERIVASPQLNIYVSQSTIDCFKPNQMFDKSEFLNHLFVLKDYVMF